MLVRSWSGIVSLILSLLSYLLSNETFRKLCEKCGIPIWIFDIAGLISILSLVVSALTFLSIVLLTELIGILRRRIPPALPVYPDPNRMKLENNDIVTIKRNRQAEIEEVNSLLESNKVVVITGDKGVGKSWLAAYTTKPQDFWYSFVSAGKRTRISGIDLQWMLIICAQWLDDKLFENQLKSKRVVGIEETVEFCKLIRKKKRILVFDNIEPLLHDETAVFIDKNMSSFLVN